MTDRSELVERLMCFDEKTNCLICLSGPERDLIIAALRVPALSSESELSRLRAEKDKLVEALAQALANCGAALRALALPSEEQIVDFFHEHERLTFPQQARALLALLGDCT